MGKFGEKYKEVFLYLVFGVLTTIISWITYAILVNLGWNMIVANVISWVFAVAFAFVTNKLWVFSSPEWKLQILHREILTFLSSRLFTGVLEMICFPLAVALGFDRLMLQLTHSLGIQSAFLEGTEGVFSKALINVVVIILNYFFSKFMVFVRKR